MKTKNVEFFPTLSMKVAFKGRVYRIYHDGENSFISSDVDFTENDLVDFLEFLKAKGMIVRYNIPPDKSKDDNSLDDNVKKDLSKDKEEKSSIDSYDKEEKTTTTQKSGTRKKNKPGKVLN